MSKKSESVIAEVFSALSDRTRLSLVARLAGNSQSATSLAEGVPLTRQGVVKHLQVLESAGLVVHKKEGREVLYTLDLSRVKLAKAFLEEASASWDRAIGALQKTVEGPSSPPKN